MPQNALDIIYQNFNNKLTARYYNRMSELGLTLDETITLASIAQREADNTTNMGNVASVFFNRMADAEAFRISNRTLPCIMLMSI